MLSKSIHTVFLTIICLLFMPLVQAHTGSHTASGLAHMLEMPVVFSVAGYVIGILSATALVLITGIALRRLVITRIPGIVKRN